VVQRIFKIFFLEMEIFSWSAFADELVKKQQLGTQPLGRMSNACNLPRDNGSGEQQQP